MVEMWFLYVVRCARDGSLYTGIAKDVPARVRAHNAGKGAKYTRARRPVELLAFWEYSDRSTVSKAEYAFKKLKREAKMARVLEFLGNHPS